MTQMGECLPMKLNHKQLLLRDVLEKVGDTLSEETVAEKVTQFCKHGNIFIFFEVMSLRKEIDRMRAQIQTLQAE
jgi:hypothetical protein